jgi:hypothetical protein
MTPPRTLDEARTAFPDLTFYIAAEGGQPVSLEVVDEAGALFRWSAPTEARCWEVAFPKDEPDAEPVARPQRPPAGPAREEHDLAQLLAPAAPAIGLFD